jgi:hypothetical protein
MPIDRDEFKREVTGGLRDLLRREFTVEWIAKHLRRLVEKAENDSTRLNALIFISKASGEYVERSSTTLELPANVYVTLELGLSGRPSVTHQPVKALSDQTERLESSPGGEVEVGGSTPENPEDE